MENNLELLTTLAPAEQTLGEVDSFHGGYLPGQQLARFGPNDSGFYENHYLCCTPCLQDHGLCCLSTCEDSDFPFPPTLEDGDLPPSASSKALLPKPAGMSFGSLLSLSSHADYVEVSARLVSPALLLLPSTSLRTLSVMAS